LTPPAPTPKLAGRRRCRLNLRAKLHLAR